MRLFQHGIMSIVFFVIAIILILTLAPILDIVYFSVVDLLKLYFESAGEIIAEILWGIAGFWIVNACVKRTFSTVINTNNFMTRNGLLLLVNVVFYCFGMYFFVISILYLIANALTLFFRIG